MDDLTVPVSWSAELRIANPPPFLLVKYTRKEKAFFDDYADFVLRLIRHHSVSERIQQTLHVENVRISGPLDIRVMVFPARSFRGQANRMLHGSYSSTASQISLYPLRIPREWIKREGYGLFQQSYSDLSDKRRKLLNQISTSAIATLLHEIFHAKLGSRGLAKYVEESIVRKMESDYMKGWDAAIGKAVPDVLANMKLSGISIDEG